MVELRYVFETFRDYYESEENAMSKRVLTVLLALALTIAMTTSAFAGTTPSAATGEAGIVFAGFNDDDDGVYDPDDLDPDLIPQNNLESMDIDFHTRAASMFTETYHSWDPDFNSGAGAFSRAGVLVLSSQPWHLQLSIGGFTHAGAPALQGFNMTLRPNNLALTGNPPADLGFFQPGAGFNPPTTWTVANEVNISAVGGAVNVANGSAGLFGSNFEGSLTVLGGTAPQGNPRAVMTWHFFHGMP